MHCLGSVDDERQTSHQSVFSSCVARSTSETSEQIHVVTTSQPQKTDTEPVPVAKVVSWKLEEESQSSSPGVVRSKSMTTEKPAEEVVLSRSVLNPSLVERHAKRPTTLSPYKIPGSRSAWAKLCSGVAPLAESECFVIENSPAVEFPPSCRPAPAGPAAEGKKVEQEQPPTILDDTYKNRVGMASRFQSRLKNPTAYANRQKIIYDRYERSVETIPADPVGKVENRADSSPTEKKKRELHDSGVKMDSIYGSNNGDATGAGVGGSASPSSLYRGLIDDEIRDQPELTIGSKSLETRVSAC